MSRIVYKYIVPVDDNWHEVSIPATARVVHTECQGSVSQVSVWAEVEVEDLGETARKMRAFGTGMAIPDGAAYIGTALGGPFVWHVYENAA